MIAGTGFLLTDVDAAWRRHGRRIARCGSSPDVLEAAARHCRERRALCLEGPDGMVIVRPVARADGTISADVLLAVSAGLHGAFERQEQAIEAIARDLGAAEIRFRTDRKGWKRLLGPAWIEQDGTFRRGV